MNSHAQKQETIIGQKGMSPQSFSIKKVSDLGECRKLWERFSPKKTIWEDWDVVSCFYSPAHHVPEFLAIMDGEGEVSGVLPFWKELAFNEYCFYGGYYLENMGFWFGAEDFPEIFEAIPPSTLLFDVNGKAAEQVIKLHPEYGKNFSHEDFRYFLNLKKIGYSLDNHLNSFSKKHRKNFLHDIRKLSELGCGVEWSGKLVNYEHFLKFNVERFGKDSNLADPLFASQTRDMLSLFEKRGKLFACSAVIDGRVVGVEYAVLHNGVYYLVNGGYDKEHPNVGKLLVNEQINNAIGQKADEVDAMAGDSGWKQLWNLEKEPYYEFKKN